jgi:hypothetical protein
VHQTTARAGIVERVFTPWCGWPAVGWTAVRAQRAVRRGLGHVGNAITAPFVSAGADRTAARQVS